MSCSRTQHGDACDDRSQDLSIRTESDALPLRHRVLPKNNFVPVLYQLHIRIYSRHVILRSDWLNHCDMKSSIELACVRACARARARVCVCVYVKNIVILF